MIGRDPRVPRNGRSDDNGDDRRRKAGFVGSRVPTRVAARALSCSLDLPSEVRVGQPTPFRFHVKNRAPIGVTLDLPTARYWGWTVDGVPEAGVGRFEPPGESVTVAFGPRERRTFTARWDGQLRQRKGECDVWTAVPGTRELTAYVALADWRERGAFATGEVLVTEP